MSGTPQSTDEPCGNVEQRGGDAELRTCDTSDSDSGSKLVETQHSLSRSPEVEIQTSSVEHDVLTPEYSRPLWTPEPSLQTEQPDINISVSDGNIEPTSFSASSIASEEIVQEVAAMPAMSSNISNDDQSNELLSGRFLDIEQLCEVLQSYPEQNAKMDLLKLADLPQSRLGEIMKTTISELHKGTDFLENGFRTSKQHFEEKVTALKQP